MLPADIHQIQQQQQQQSHNNPETAAIQQAGRWLAKLQLAHFCWMGLYPTWVHRFAGHSFVPTAGEMTSRLYHQPTTAKLVGILIGAQLVVTGIQATSSAVCRWLVRREQTTGLSFSPWSSSQQPAAPAVIFQTARGSDNAVTAHASTDGNSRSSSSICSICKLERKNPAAPTSCGHVFCWRCLSQWVSTIRPECPLCRAECRPQDIVALHNYSPNR
jgi:Ring finger domain